MRAEIAIDGNISEGFSFRCLDSAASSKHFGYCYALSQNAKAAVIAGAEAVDDKGEIKYSYLKIFVLNNGDLSKNITPFWEETYHHVDPNVEFWKCLAITDGGTMVAGVSGNSAHVNDGIRFFSTKSEVPLTIGLQRSFKGNAKHFLVMDPHGHEFLMVRSDGRVCHVSRPDSETQRKVFAYDLPVDLDKSDRITGIEYNPNDMFALAYRKSGDLLRFHVGNGEILAPIYPMKYLFN